MHKKRIKIPVQSEPVNECTSCQAACCRAYEILPLTLQEAAFMQRAGNRLLTVAFPSTKFRENVQYPIGIEFDTTTGVHSFIVEKEREFEPLAANFGRYVLLNDCKYLETDEAGWQHCGTYDDRPIACRDFEEGGKKCHQLQVVQKLKNG